MSLLTFQTMRQCPKSGTFVSDAKLEVDEMKNNVHACTKSTTSNFQPQIK